MTLKLQKWLSEISIPVYILVIFFAISSWVDMNGMWVQLPIFVHKLPEGWDLPSYLITFMQIGNIGALTFFITNRLAPNKVKEWPVVYIIVGIGTICCMLLAFLWHVTTVVGGVRHSTVLIALSTVLALVDCTSSVVYLPFMSVFKPQYMTAFWIGNGLSGLIPALVAMGQGIGGEPVCMNTSILVYNSTTGENSTTWKMAPEYQELNFPPQIFFFILFGLMCASGICFTLLKFSSFCKREMLSSSHELAQEAKQHPDNLFSPVCKEIHTTGSKVRIGQETVNTPQNESRDEDGIDPKEAKLGTAEYVVLLFMAMWIGLLSIGVIHSIQSYASLPYGDSVYNLSLRLCRVADPLGSFLSLLLPLRSTGVLSIFVVAGSGLMSYQMALATLSPEPPLKDETSGQVLCIGSAVLMIFILSYVRVNISCILQCRGGRRALVWCGFLSQVGVFIGAVSMFLVVNVFHLLEQTRTD